MLQYISVPVVTMSLDEMIDMDRLVPSSAIWLPPRPTEEEVESNSAISGSAFCDVIAVGRSRYGRKHFLARCSQAEVARSLGLSRMAITKRMKKIYRLGLVLLPYLVHKLLSGVRLPSATVQS